MALLHDSSMTLSTFLEQSQEQLHMVLSTVLVHSAIFRVWQGIQAHYIRRSLSSSGIVSCSLHNVSSGLSTRSFSTSLPTPSVSTCSSPRPVSTCPPTPPVSTRLSPSSVSTCLPTPPVSTCLPTPPVSTCLPTPPVSTCLPTPSFSTCLPCRTCRTVPSRLRRLPAWHLPT